ncbi:MAG: polysaccharide deacetylase family protein [Weeksellaceae bacterium]|nr:polysaccharide deacetylase family protein [Weeksellaceae bacterium]
MQKVLIYSPQITKRIRFLFDFVCNEFSGLQTEYTDNLQTAASTAWPLINYSNEQLPSGHSLAVDEVMFQTGLDEKINFGDLKPVGKCFYALSRYEEYLPHTADKHGRFSGHGKVYASPFVDEWIIGLQQQLKTIYPTLVFKERKFNILLTSDVDQAWKYQYKGWLRNSAAFFKALLKGHFAEVSDRVSVFLGKKKDPFDTFDYFFELAEKHGVPVIFFWLMGDYGTYDKNNPVSNTAFRKLISEVSSWAESGIHPSYASFGHREILKRECARLQAVLSRPVRLSRQHYLRLTFPSTYRDLLSVGITDDYTMGYADTIGFRAGTCTPFYWYDLEREEKTLLKLHPFCAMDVSLRHYGKLSPEEATAELLRLRKAVERVNGQYCLLFHNSNLTDDWKGWKQVLESVF